MKNIITKTINLIVFVVFLQLIIMPNVYADTKNAATICQYTYSSKDGPVVISVEIGNDNTIWKRDDSNFSGKIYNWDSNNDGYFNGDKIGLNDADKAKYQYSAKEEYVKNGYKCPAYIVLDEDIFGDDDISFARDKAMADGIADKVGNDGHVCEFLYQGTTSEAKEEIKESNPDTTAKRTSCQCLSTSTSEQITINFTIDENVSEPTVGVKINGREGKLDFQNWNKQYANSPYVYSTEFIKNNKCPEYVLIAKGEYTWGKDHRAAFSDAANKASLSSAIGSYRSKGTYELSCTETTTQQSNSNSNKKSDWTYSVSNPKVGSNVKPLDGDLRTYSCGEGYLTGIPFRVPRLGKIIYNFIQILVPVIIILLGTFDLVKSITAQKDDEIQKGRTIFFKRLLSAILVFFVFALAKLAISLIARNTSTIFDCVDCILRDNGSCVEE